MSTFKRCQVIMLLTESNSKTFINTPFWRNNEAKTLHYYGEKVRNGIDCDPQHLYILSDEEIKEGDWKYNPRIGGWQHKRKGKEMEIIHPETRKIIATTDTLIQDERESLFGSGKDYNCSVPKLSEEFVKAYIEAYNAGNPITEVDVEYESLIDETSAKYLVNEYLKVNPKDNTVTIRKIKDSWNRKEIEALLSEAYQQGRSDGLMYDMEHHVMGFDNWIKQNL